MENKPTQSRIEVLYFISMNNGDKLYIQKAEYEDLYKEVTDPQFTLSIGGVYVANHGTDQEKLVPMKNISYIGKEVQRSLGRPA